MRTWIALLRGINVGGHRKLPMKELTALLEGLGCEGVRTYIQSGNAVYRAERDLADEIADAIERAKGFRAAVMTLEAEAFEAAVDGNPFPEAVDEPKTLHLFFLSGPAGPGAVERLRAVKSKREDFVLNDRVLYLHTLDLLTGSKIAEKAERLLGAGATARNWNSVTKILDLARQVAAGHQ